MKKILICFMALFMAFGLASCKKSDTRQLEDSLSEVTKLYFEAKGDNITGSISVGDREKNYIIDGVHGSCCEFSLIQLKFKTQPLANKIDVELNINEKTLFLTLDINPINNTYMGDLGYNLNEDDKIILTYEDESLTFDNVSKNFQVDYKKALEIAKKEFGDELNAFYNKDNFEGEGYLKILNQSINDKDGLYWILTIVGKDKLTKNIIIDVENGNVLIKN